MKIIQVKWCKGCPYCRYDRRGASMWQCWELGKSVHMYVVAETLNPHCRLKGAPEQYVNVFGNTGYDCNMCTDEGECARDCNGEHFVERRKC